MQGNMSGKIIIVDAPKSLLQSHGYRHIPVPEMPTYQNSKMPELRKQPFPQSQVFYCQKYLENLASQYNMEPPAKKSQSSNNIQYVDMDSRKKFCTTADSIMTLYEGTLGQLSPYKIPITVMPPGDLENAPSMPETYIPQPFYRCLDLLARRRLKFNIQNPTKKVPKRLKLLISQRARLNKAHLASQHRLLHTVNNLSSACLNVINKIENAAWKKLGKCHKIV